MGAKIPYAGLPPHQVWKRAVSDAQRDEIDPQTAPAFGLDRSTKIASAGSCFAARIADRLREAGFTYFVTEPGGRYSARYGDIYSTLQLAQLAARAVGSFAPAEPPWVRRGRFFDPLRPRVELDGYASVAALEAARATHLAAVRRLLTESDVLVFTLGLTETWCTREDGTALPLVPGAGIGTFDDARYVFRNLSVDENVRALEDFLAIAWSLNPSLRLILTVSPVPLAATMEPRHIVQATTYSKSVLRVAAETIRARYDQVEYFASYEIVAGGYSGDDNYADDRREVTDAAVDRVMRSFFRSFAGEDGLPPGAGDRTSRTGSNGALKVVPFSLDTVAKNARRMTAANDPCDESFLAGIITTC